MPNNRSSRFSRKAFTLIELLVVIGIIAILVSLLLPIYSKVRTASYVASTRAEIGTISNAINQYYADFNAYPGPFSNAEIEVPADFPTITGPGGSPPYMGPITMSQNLVLGLLGGLTIYNNGVATSNVYFDTTTVGLGPLSLNSVNPRRSPAYLQNTQGLVSNGQFKDASGHAATDNNGIPVFIDQFSNNPLPILYLRANVGAPGVIGYQENGGKLQYDYEQIIGYTQLPSPALGSPSYTGTGQTSPHEHGIRGFDNYYPMGTHSVTTDFPNNLIAYFLNYNATINGSSTQANGRPRMVDQYILISAGADGTYGTTDDLTNFGDVVQQ